MVVVQGLQSTTASVGRGRPNRSIIRGREGLQANYSSSGNHPQQWAREDLKTDAMDAMDATTKDQLRENRVEANECSTLEVWISQRR